MSKSVTRRSYDNSRREAGARETRRSIVSAARELFVEVGYPSSTFSTIADRAEVSVQTVYSHFPDKLGLLNEVVDQAIAGDGLSVPIADRSEVTAVRAEADPRQKLRLHASFVATVMQRAAPVDQMLRSAASVDLGTAELWSRGAAARLEGMREFAIHLSEGGHLRGSLTIQQAAERLAALMNPDIYRMTVADMNWTSQQYEEWLAEMFVVSLLP